MLDNLLLPVTLLLAFLAVVVAAEGLFNGFLGARDRQQRLKRRLEVGGGPAARPTSLIREERVAGASPALEILLQKGDLWLGQANIGVSPQAFVGYVLAAAGGLWVLSSALLWVVGAAPSLQDSLLSAVGCLLLAVVCAWLFVQRRRQARLRNLESQLPLALDIVIRAIRAGHPVVSAVQLVTEELGDPIAHEFRLIVDETTYGVEFREALRNFARRTGSSDAHFFAVSVAIQAETGGNLAEILNNLATVIRGRITLGKRVKALASEGRMSAGLLSALPVMLISFMFITQPSFYVSKFGDPIFWPTVIGVAIVYVIGQLIMHRIVNFKY